MEIIWKKSALLFCWFEMRLYLNYWFIDHEFQIYRQPCFFAWVLTLFNVYTTGFQKICLVIFWTKPVLLFCNLKWDYTLFLGLLTLNFKFVVDHSFCQGDCMLQVYIVTEFLRRYIWKFLDKICLSVDLKWDYILFNYILFISLST